jgi:hypothetical protein
MTVFVLQIEHQHGVNTYAYSTRDLAHKAIEAYVSKWWKKEIGDPPPDDLTGEDFVEAYFEQVDEESYEIFTCELDQALSD